MKKLFYLILLCSTSLFGQVEESNNKVTDSIATQHNYITFNPLAMLDFTAPRYTFGYIKTIDDRWKVGVQLGYGNQAVAFVKNDEEKDNYNLFDIRPEVYYVIDTREKATHYLSIEFQYLQHQERFFNDYFYDDNRDTRTRYDQADLTRKKYAATLKFGSFFDLGGRIGLNAYYGFGVRARDNSFDNAINPTLDTNDLDDQYFSGLQDLYRRRGKVVGVNVVLGIQLTYQLD